jgi:AcrR family transcriptional regulator
LGGRAVFKRLDRAAVDSSIRSGGYAVARRSQILMMRFGLRTVNQGKRRRIIDSAAELFAERHYHEVHMDAIARRAGVAKGTIYLHFKDKEALYLALVEDGMDRLLAKIDASLAEVESAEGKIEVLVRESVVYFARNRYLFELVQRAESMCDSSLSGAKPNRDRFLRIVTDLVERVPGMRDRPASRIQIAVLAFAGMMREIFLNLPQPWPGDLAEQLIAQFFHGITPESHATPTESPSSHQ